LGASGSVPHRLNLGHGNAGCMRGQRSVVAVLHVWVAACNVLGDPCEESGILDDRQAMIAFDHQSRDKLCIELVLLGERCPKRLLS
jgi:hypothetical protein